MRIRRTRAVSALLAVLALVAAPLSAATAFAADVQLYELTENMKLVGGKLVHRKATSELMGTANAGTPLCPLPVTCTINVTGSDNISMATGLGNFGGTFTVVVQGDNPVDSPEFVVAKGKFKGKMDFSPAVLGGIPLGTVVGQMVLDGAGGTVPFTGTFRLPFVLGPTNTPAALLAALNAYFGGSTADAAFVALFQSLGVDWGQLPLTPFPTAFYTDQPSACPNGILSCSRPLYMADDGNVFPVQASEYGLGYPPVRFEIKF
jgi:hypothetical protein